MASTFAMRMSSNDDSPKGEKTPARKRRRACPTWSDLSLDLLRLIFCYLTSPWDAISFRGVCSSWRSVPDHPPKIPSLLLPYDHESTTRSFFDPSDCSVHTINIPEARGKWLYGTPYGWLVMLGKKEMDGNGGFLFNVSLFNIISRNLKSLPLLSLNELPRSTKVLLTANPVSSSQYNFVGLLIYYKLAFCSLEGGQVWKVVDLSGPSRPFPRIMVDFTYVDGKFYLVDCFKRTTVVSTTSLKKSYIAPPNYLSSRNLKLHLVEWAGDLLLLERTAPYSACIFKLDRSKKKLKWVWVEENIAGMILFVSFNHNTISLSSRDFVGCEQDGVRFAGNGMMVKCIPCVVPENLYFYQIVAEQSLQETLNGLTWITPTMS